MTGGKSRDVHRTREDLVDATVAASRALVGVAARSLAGMSEDVTLPQYRVLVLLASRGPQRVVDLAHSLDVNPSTATRMCDRLKRKELVDREPVPGDRRAVRLVPTESGAALVRAVMRRRRTEVGRILDKMSAAQRREVADGLTFFAEAAGEAPEQEWSVGWR
ncbi:MAG: MarR family winged helix-turn-helix transcriptional regulator [Streptosporangiales bacterium]